MAQRELATDDTVWVCANNTRKAAVGTIKGVFESGSNVWAEVELGTDYFDWDQEQKLISMADHPIMQLPLYRLEPVRW